ANPNALLMDSAGNFYGRTANGGSYGGTIFRLSPTGTGWSETVLYNFCPTHDGNCLANGITEDGLVMDGAGNIYGTDGHYTGSIFQLSPSGSGWTFSTLYKFCSLTGCADGENPYAGVIMDGTGNLYGTTIYGGSQNGGVVYKLSPSGAGWTETV